MWLYCGISPLTVSGRGVHEDTLCISRLLKGQLGKEQRSSSRWPEGGALALNLSVLDESLRRENGIKNNLSRMEAFLQQSRETPIQSHLEKDCSIS